MAAPTPEVKRILSLLEGIIALKKVPIGTIEKALEVSQGYLARILRGDVNLRYQHILDVLEIIGVPPGELFGIAYPGQGKPPSELAQFLSQHGAPTPLEEEKKVPNVPAEEIAEVLLKKLLEKGAALQFPAAPQKPGNPPRGKGGSRGKSPRKR
jgi:transcriptional regulator with XRE-family HTH domain